MIELKDIQFHEPVDVRGESRYRIVPGSENAKDIKVELQGMIVDGISTIVVSLQDNIRNTKDYTPFHNVNRFRIKEEMKKVGK